MRILTVGAMAFAIGISATFAEGAEGPSVMTEAEMEKIVAGVGANNVAVQPWDALQGAGFSLNHLNPADNGADQTDNLGGVAVPSAVPDSSCLAFC